MVHLSMRSDPNHGRIASLFKKSKSSIYNTIAAFLNSLDGPSFPVYYNGFINAVMLHAMAGD
jgi:hypothetical protein